MFRNSSRKVRALVLVVLTAVACQSPPAATGPRLVQPGMPGEASRVLGSSDGIGQPLPHTEADVRFMQGMIHHHAQALAMTELARARAGSVDVQRLALRIALSQDDEIKLMQDWLEARGEPVPTVSIEHMHHLMGAEHEFMPGMLTHDQMARLAAVSGAEFDRLFLEMMIQHHEGALVMVMELFAADGAAYEEEIHQLASHIEADQSIEIRRMQSMLNALR